MAFPTSVVSLTKPTASDKMNVVDHAAQHTVVDTEIEAIETALGANMANVVVTTQLDTDTSLAAASDTKVATQKAVKAYADAIVIAGGGIPVGYLDTDITMSADSDTKVATQKATKAYVDSRTMQFVSRGDLSAYDFVVTDLTKDGAWYDLNISSIVPASTQAILVYVSMISDTAGVQAQIRTNGYVNAYNRLAGVSQVAGRNFIMEGFVPCDAGRLLEYNFQNTGTWSTINILIKGWIV
jgi:hypothetical protein